MSGGLGRGCHVHVVHITALTAVSHARLIACLQVACMPRMRRVRQGFAEYGARALATGGTPTVSKRQWYVRRALAFRFA